MLTGWRDLRSTFRVKSPPAPWEQWVDDWFDTSVDECLEYFKGDTQHRDGTVALWVPQWLFWLSDRNYYCSSPDLWNFDLAHAGSKSRNCDLRADPAWSMNSGKMESNPGDFPGFRRLRAAASFSGLKGSEILWPSGIGIFHRSDSPLLASVKD